MFSQSQNELRRRVDTWVTTCFSCTRKFMLSAERILVIQISLSRALQRDAGNAEKTNVTVMQINNGKIYRLDLYNIYIIIWV